MGPLFPSSPPPSPPPSKYGHGFWSYIKVFIVFVTICTIRCRSFFLNKVHAFLLAPARGSIALCSPCFNVICVNIIDLCLHSVVSRCGRPSASSQSSLIATFSDRVFLILKRALLACLLTGRVLRSLFNRSF